MTRTIQNLSRPGQTPAEGDWVRETTRDAQNRVVSVVEHEYHEPAEEE
jgi:hypothetical protein